MFHLRRNTSTPIMWEYGINKREGVIKGKFWGCAWKEEDMKGIILKEIIPPQMHRCNRSTISKHSKIWLHNQSNKANNQFKLCKAVIYPNDQNFDASLCISITDCEVLRSLHKKIKIFAITMIYEGMLSSLKMLLFFENVATIISSKNLKIHDLWRYALLAYK